MAILIIDTNNTNLFFQNIDSVFDSINLNIKQIKNDIKNQSIEMQEISKRTNKFK